jgi:ribosomal-protein-alanine N-acetyltransferase
MLLGKILKNSSVYLRDLLISDVSIEYINWLNNPSVNKYMDVRFKPPSLDEQVAYVNECINSSDKVILGIFTLEDRFIGTLKLSYLNSMNIEIGIMIGDQTMQGKGYGKSAIQLIKKWAKSNGISFLHAGYLSENIRSMKLFESTGFIEIKSKLVEKVGEKTSNVCRVKLELNDVC